MAHVVEGPGGNRLAVEISGAPPGKHAVFLLHGTPGTLSGPRPRGIFLHRLGIRLISYNRPGYPGSDRQKYRSVADAAEDVKAIADHLDIREFSVIGRSGGAPHALACAAASSLHGRVKCVAALSGLAPYDAENLDWFHGMAESNRRAYRNVQDNLGALIRTLNQHAEQVRNNPESLLNTLWPEFTGSDKEAVGDIVLRKIIAQTHAEALRESTAGWVDDVLALGHSWGFSLSDITVPVLLWHGGDDVFSPVSHTVWLAQHIKSAELHLQEGTAHFGAVKALPEILGWVHLKVDPHHVGPSRGPRRLFRTPAGQ
ncbi:MAG TPA: alpha/beta hydrolase [Planctomycetota bacterium]|nr:alpha/beta hydrolase [Planctomycetota bacterium]